MRDFFLYILLMCISNIYILLKKFSTQYQIFILYLRNGVKIFEISLKKVYTYFGILHRNVVCLLKIIHIA